MVSSSTGQGVPAAGSFGGAKDRPYLRGHAADGGDVVAGIEEVGGVRLQLELAQPVVNRFCVLGRGKGKEQPVMGAAGAGRTCLLQAR